MTTAPPHPKGRPHFLRRLDNDPSFDHANPDEVPLHIEPAVPDGRDEQDLDHGEEEDLDRGDYDPAATLAEAEEALLLASRIAYERRARTAKRVVREEELSEGANLEAIDVVSAADLLERPGEERVPLLGDLVMEGHNATVTARYKVGKSTLTENVTCSLVLGEPFLGRYEVPQRRVAYLNYELTSDDMTARLQSLGLKRPELERIKVFNLRGHRLPLLTDLGRDWLVRQLIDHGAQVLIVDPYGAALTQAGAESENDNVEGRRFCNLIDEIKRLSGCMTAFVPVHTGRAAQEEGDERGRGATAIDDWADVRMVLTKNKAGERFLRTEGRAVDLAESRLGYDGRRLMLATTDLGVNRRDTKHQELAATVAEVVEENPGINARDLRTELTGLSTTDRDGAVKTALKARAVHRHAGPNRSQLHYLGASHEGQDCPSGYGVNG